MKDSIQTIHISSIGNSGDGIGVDENGKSWYIPSTFIGEVAEAAYIAPRGKGVAGRAVSVTKHSINRQKEPCVHALTCGGCSLQHMKDDFYKNWQVEMVENILSQNSLNVPVKHIFQTEKNSRRRATFHAVNEEGRIKVGFFNSFSQKVEYIDGCLVLTDKLKAVMPKLEELFSKILKPRKRAEASVTLCENGLAILLKFPKKIKTSAKEILSSYSNKGLCLRLSIQEGDNNSNILWQTEDPYVYFGKSGIPIAVGGFLQATKGGEQAIVNSVCNYVSGSNNILELFAGNGTLTLPLLELGKPVTAVELNSDSLRMLKSGAGKYAEKLSVAEKNLFTEIYSTNELNNYDCIVLDPPRAGAKKQITAISRTKIAKVIMVSCNIKTFAQDGKILLENGYKLDEVLLIDQFLWTPHVEVVGCFIKLNS